MSVTDEEGNVLVWPYGTPWSHSMLTRFEQCELMFGEPYMNKGKYEFVESEAMRLGNQIHRKLEMYVTVGAGLPLMLQPIAKLIDRLCKDAIKVTPERDVNLTHRLEPCGIFHPDVSYRGRIDLTIIRPRDEAIILDYKTGRTPNDPDEQIVYQALAVLLENPNLKAVHGAYVYTKHPRRQIKPVTREDIPQLVKAMTPRLERLKRARDTNSYSATPGHYCRWCPIVDCEYNPKN